jgi:hypothetical protein
MMKLLKSYFYWTYSRGSFHYDVMVTLILLFIFVTPQFWNFGDKASSLAGPAQPIQVVGNDGHGLILTVAASDVNVATDASDAVVRKALRKAIEPVTGDAEYVEHWELSRDASGNPVAWKIWAHR